jgi:hypothetical protein
MMFPPGSRPRKASPFSLSKWFSSFSELEPELLLSAFRTEYLITAATLAAQSEKPAIKKPGHSKQSMYR